MTTPDQPRTVHVNGVELAYVEQGRGDPVVFVHGSLSDYRSWGPQMAPFAEHHRVVAYSRRYYSPNPRPSAGAACAVGEHAADLGALVEALGLPPAHLVGLSYGALTALTLAVARPELVRSLVLTEPPLLPWLAAEPDGAALAEAFLASAFEPARRAFVRGETEAGVRLFVEGAAGPGSFDRMTEAARGRRFDNAAAMRAEMLAPPAAYWVAPSPEAVGRLPTPTLLVQGELSPPMYGRVTEELARVLPAAERVTIPGAWHGPHTENPTAYNSAVLAFLAKQ